MASLRTLRKSDCCVCVPALMRAVCSGWSVSEGWPGMLASVGHRGSMRASSIRAAAALLAGELSELSSPVASTECRRGDGSRCCHSPTAVVAGPCGTPRTRSGLGVTLTCVGGCGSWFAAGRVCFGCCGLLSSAPRPSRLENR
jgi:hypothetical protein